MTPREKLSENTEQFVRMIEEYPDDLFNQKPDEESWSAAEITEHIFRSEFGIPRLLIGEKSEKGGQHPEPSVEEMESVMLDTSRKAKAFGPILPTGELSDKSKLISRLRNTRKSILESYNNTDPDLLCMSFEHPMFGYLSAEKWIEFTVLHTRRHMKQMENTLNLLLFAIKKEIL